MKEFDSIVENEEIESLKDEEVMELAILAGKILLSSGAEIFRVEETMMRICEYYGVHSANSFVLSNGIMATAGSPRENLFAKVMHIPVSGAHLDRVAAVNELSREIIAGKHTVEEAMEELRLIQEMPEKSPVSQMLASGIGSAAFCVLFGGDVRDCVCSFISGFALYFYILKIAGPHLSKIVRNVLGGMIVTLICSFFYVTRFANHMNFMIIGSIMPLVPGMAFTNGIRDIGDGDYISGFVRMADALLVFICIAIGVGMGISLVELLGGGIPLWSFSS